MFLPFRNARALALALSVALPLLAVPADAAAQSRRQQAQALVERMHAAEARYREALVQIANADPAGSAAADAALEDMEDAITRCSAIRGCEVTTLLASYKRLLKLEADAGGVDDLPESTGTGHHLHALAGDVPEAARAAALLEAGDGHGFDRMVRFNPAVQEGIRRWLTDMRGAFMTSWENYQHLRARMWPQYERAGLPEALLFGIMAKESNGRVHSTSRAGAAGPMQFMYATGRRFGLGDDGTGFDTRYDPYAASEASVGYLNERLRELNRDLELALAAYNGGEGRAARVARANPGKSFWHEDVYHQFPPETRDYVPMVIAAAWLFLHPEEYGLSLPKVDARPAAFVLEQPATIYQLTICLGNRGVREGYMRVLRNLNPRYRADDWLQTGTRLEGTVDIANLYRRQCVAGPRAELARTLVTVDPAAAVVRRAPGEPTAVAVAATSATTPAPRRYEVQRGETLLAISRKFQCDVGELARANHIRGPNYLIRPGQSLRLAGCRGSS